MTARPRTTLIALAVVAAVGLLAAAGFGQEDGWRPLFNGKDLTGWQNAAGKEPGKGWVVEDGTLVRKEKAGDIWTKERFGDFVLDLEFKTTGNSGVFLRTDNPRDNVQTGIEIQLDRPASRPGKHSCGAVYDCLAPTKEASRPDEWNRLVITARANRLGVVLNGEPIIDMDLDQWTEPRKNPDGTKNKFRTALKDFKREGHIGFQDHGAVVLFRNVKIKPLGPGEMK
jgi:hypothetical protein